MEELIVLFKEDISDATLLEIQEKSAIKRIRVMKMTKILTVFIISLIWILNGI